MQVIPIKSPDDIPAEMIPIQCIISGGTFDEYLKAMKEQYKSNICLVLEHCFYRFHLPCYDGQGSPISEEKIKGLITKYGQHFSVQLCTNYIYIPDAPSVILFDTDETLRKKYDLAVQCGIPACAASMEIIKKLRLPE